jgi:hypothetical protein
MLYSEIKRAVLSRIHQYSISGKTIAESYNNQADYLNRIPLFVNEGLMAICTSVKPIPATADAGVTLSASGPGINRPIAGGRSLDFDITSVEPTVEAGVWFDSDETLTLKEVTTFGIGQPGYSAKLPEDFWRLRTGGIEKLESDGRYHRTNNYKLRGKNRLVFPEKAFYRIEYYRYPQQLPLDPADDDELTEDPDVLQAAIVYAAANLVMYDDEHAYAVLYNDYESRLSRLVTGPDIEVHTVEDSYCFNGGWDA